MAEEESADFFFFSRFSFSRFVFCSLSIKVLLRIA